MELTNLGASDLLVTRMGLGLAALGRPGYINLGHAQDLKKEYEISSMERHAHDVLDAAWEAGIRYFDAARSYGRAEAFLSSWLAARQISPASVTVGSKWGYTYTADWQVSAEHHEIKEHSLAVLDRQITESRELLGPHLDLYQIHSATLESGVLDNQGVLTKLAELRDNGLAIGLSTSGPRQSDTILRALDVEIGGSPLFTSVQVTWNILAQETGGVLNAAHERGLGIIVKEAVANGRLTDRNRDPAFAYQRQRLQDLARTHDTTIDAIALAAVLAQPWIGVVLSGAASVDQLQSNVRAFEIAENAWVDGLLQDLREEKETYWRYRSVLAWN